MVMAKDCRLASAAQSAAPLDALGGSSRMEPVTMPWISFEFSSCLPSASFGGT